MAVTPQTPSLIGFKINFAPVDFDPATLPEGFLDFLAGLHKRFTPWQEELIDKRRRQLAASLQGRKPAYLPPSEATTTDWRIELPEWCQDQRNQMTGPADDAELVVKMLNSGAPGVMLDLEDSTANTFDRLELGVRNIHAALRGELRYFDKKRDKEVSIQPSGTVIWIRVRGLHLHQGGVLGKAADGMTSASLWDVCRVAYEVDAAALKHPLAFYIPKTESADEAHWWRALFQEIEKFKGWEKGAIKCMALVESHPMPFQMEEFLYHLREHILGLNLGRWDYMASLIHYNLDDPEWVLPDRNTIPHDVAFFQNVRELMPELCHRHGALAIGGMTALYPSRDDAELNERALAVLEKDKRNESLSGFDGAWTGHPDQNQIAVDQFPAPNQLGYRKQNFERYPGLRPLPTGVGARTVEGTRAAIRTVIRYRNGVLNGKGASLLDGYMEDLATDRIYRLMIHQRMRHSDLVPIAGPNGEAVRHTARFIHTLFDEELQNLLTSTPKNEAGTKDTLTKAREISESMVLTGEFDPV